MNEIRLGTIGSGFIVNSFLYNVQRTEGICLEAVFSRTMERGNALAQRYHAQKVYTDLQQFLADKDINCVYIASPNSLHYPYAKAALLAGKHVICEKPFATSAAYARELVALAEEQGLMLVDATPTAFLPNLEILREQLPKIGRLRLVMTNYSQYSSRYDSLLEGNVTNVFSPMFGGGCLMDINYYNLYLNINLFGKPESAAYFPNRWENGIDTSGCLVLNYPDFISSNVGAKDTWGVNYMQFEGEKGYIYVSGNNNLEKIQVVTKTDSQSYNLQTTDDRLFYEVQAVTNLLLNEDRKTLSSLLSIMVNTMEVLEKARLDAGIRFDGE